MNFSPLLAWFLILSMPEAPTPLTDLNVFAPHEAVEVQLDTSREHYRWVMQQLENCQRCVDVRTVAGGGYAYTVVIREEAPPEIKQQWEAWLAEAKWCFECWDMLFDATHDRLRDERREDMLLKLREQLGNEAYYTGRMPPPVPLWMSQEKP